MLARLQDLAVSDMVLENPLIVTAANICVCQTDKAGESFFFVYSYSQDHGGAARCKLPFAVRPGLSQEDVSTSTLGWAGSSSN